MLTNPNPRPNPTCPQEGPTATKRSRGLLHVPSRSSSQKNQPSPTASGLSGVTASESRESFGDRSKGSKASIMGRHRNGSASSNRSAVETAQTATSATANAPVQQKKKKGGLLSLFCCGVPDDANALDNEPADVPGHKVDKLPHRPRTASRRQTPSEHGGSKAQLTEKDALAAQTGADSSKANRASLGPTVQDPPAPAEEPTQVAPTSPAGPTVTVQPPPQEAVVPGPAGRQVHDKDDDGDIPMADAAQEWLLPPIQSHLKGRKCLVLDLDETLVHSSFKILHQADFTIPVEIEGNYHNVYVIKRPGVDQFMKRVGELYEVVVFTASVSKYGDPLLDQLDIHGVVHHRLFRESCHNHGGNYVKDLSKVGRDLKDTIIIDNSPTSYIFHPQHAVPISSWFSDAHDNELLDLIPVLEDLAGANVQDVSLVLDVTL
ncbi:hypothetical protein M406DRAFT_63216 [Cryphonectria parasitica EP155]|uniref:FCP1 homology domain-containing protein n=1 Tax=Cryphonectria parasitica (strain ATCC 38755 / EP155) TaxID=660469 RepID=A0A9P5CKH3_CRYP1|nr:uncharacterized protein M406DRAFT_63216 [Cryphonectria parasitica EP155]KAF3762244.1 hypothetical protein M406DRAFT_63216 [Cryphonectria parasitica EP155]